MALAVAANPMSACALEAESSNDSIHFDIPAQPLPAALERFSALSGWQMLYIGRLAVGRASTAVQGRFDRDTALQTLLKGSGLLPRHIAPDAVSLDVEPSDGPGSVGAGESVNPPPTIAAYYAVVQNGIQSSLCSNPRTRRASYRIAAKLWVDSGGGMSRVELLGSSADRSLDRDIAGILRALILSRPPPVDLPQPIVLLVDPGMREDCERIERGSARSSGHD